MWKWVRAKFINNQATPGGPSAPPTVDGSGAPPVLPAPTTGGSPPVLPPPRRLTGTSGAPPILPAP
jgi:hypothetical protein